MAGTAAAGCSEALRDDMAGTAAAELEEPEAPSDGAMDLGAALSLDSSTA